MGKIIGYTVAGGIIGWMCGAVVLIIINPTDPRLLVFLYGGAAIGAFLGLRFAGVVGIELPLPALQIRPYLIFVALALAVYQCSGFFKTGSNPVLFYCMLMIIVAVLYVRYAWEIAIYSKGDIWPRFVMTVLFFALGYASANNPVARALDPSSSDGLMILFVPMAMMFFTYLASIAKWNGAVKYVERKAQEEELLKAYGSKDWASSERVFRALKGATDGVYIGGGFHFNEQGNILTVGGPRGGKGVNLILPALLDGCLIKPNAQSWVVLDPKGENCAVTAPYLKWAGYNVLVINPFGIPEIEQFGNARFNVFDLFNVYTPGFSSFVDMVLYALIPVSSKQDDFFDNAGRELIRFHIGYMMLQDIEPKTFRTLYNWLHLAGKERHDLLLKMVGCTGLDGIVKAGAMSIIGLLDDDAGKTVGNIYKSATQAISVFGDTQLRHSVSGSDFTLQNIAQEKTAIFVCVNPSELNRTQAWLRILFNSFIDNMLRNYNARRKTVFLFDELHKLGSLKVVKDNISYLPGYHVTIWSIVQSLGQLKGAFQKC